MSLAFYYEFLMYLLLEYINTITSPHCRTSRVLAWAKAGHGLGHRLGKKSFTLGAEWLWRGFTARF